MSYATVLESYRNQGLEEAVENLDELPETEKKAAANQLFGELEDYKEGRKLLEKVKEEVEYNPFTEIERLVREVYSEVAKGKNPERKKGEIVALAQGAKKKLGDDFKRTVEHENPEPLKLKSSTKEFGKLIKEYLENAEPYEENKSLEGFFRDSYHNMRKVLTEVKESKIDAIFDLDMKDQAELLNARERTPKPSLRSSQE
ncbi:MAG: hypothetical protein ACLFTQ_01540 [Candidatus Aenigmatarchaeota archaeon]